MAVKEFLKTREAAEYVNVKQQTLAKWRMDARHLPFIRVGGQIRYRKSDLDRYLESRTVGAALSTS